jgi:predicted metal-dependent hydrolase
MKFEGIPVEIIVRPVKYSRIEFKSAGLRMIVPWGVRPNRILNENRKFILKKYNKMMKQVEIAKKLPLVDRKESQFRDLVYLYTERFSKQLKTTINEVKFRKMKRRWGTCRNTGIITLNKCLQFVPEPLMAYVIYHEIAHTIVMKHDHKFKRLVASEFPNFQHLDKELTLYGLKLFM